MYFLIQNSLEYQIRAVYPIEPRLLQLHLYFSFFSYRFMNTSISLEETCSYNFCIWLSIRIIRLFMTNIFENIHFSLMSLDLATSSGISVDPIGLSMLQNLSTFIFSHYESRFVSHLLLYWSRATFPHLFAPHGNKSSINAITMQLRYP